MADSTGDESKDHWKSVLIIDDDETIIKSLRPFLISHSYAVLSAETGEIGLEIARNQKPDLILLDVILPGIKGREVCKTLKEDPETKGIPVIFVTAKESSDDVLAELDAGGELHLTKPVQYDKLLAAIRQFIDQ
jgi:twitching motility two-component system response regulator PilH